MNFETIKDEVYKTLEGTYIDDCEVIIDAVFIDETAGKLIFLASEDFILPNGEKSGSCRYYYGVYDVWTSKALMRGTDSYKEASAGVPKAGCIKFTDGFMEQRKKTEELEHIINEFLTSFSCGEKYKEFLKERRSCAANKFTFDICTYFIGDSASYQDSMTEKTDEKTDGKTAEKNEDKNPDSVSYKNISSDDISDFSNSEIKKSEGFKTNGVQESVIVPFENNQQSAAENVKSHSWIITAASITAGILGIVTAVIFFGP